MKGPRSELLNWSERLSIFRPRFDDLETCTYRMERAREQIQEFKRMYRGGNLSFVYRRETIHGKFVTAIEGDIPGTYMVILRIRSSRICSGPCFLRVGYRRIGGIVGIAARAGG